MNRDKTIILDLDDTLTNTGSVVIKYASIFQKEILGKARIAKNNQLCSHHLYFAEALNWDNTQLKQFFDIFYPYYLLEIKPKKNISKMVSEIYQKYKIIIITSRVDTENGSVKHLTENWLKKHNINYDELILCSNKSKIINSMNNIIAYVDDSLDNFENIIDKNIQLYLITTKFNKKITTNNIKRISTLEELLYL